MAATYVFKGRLYKNHTTFKYKWEENSIKGMTEDPGK